MFANSFELFIQRTVDGLAAGSIYALLALALVVVFRGSGQLNFAQGEMGMFCAFVASTLTLSGLPLWLSILLSMVVGFVMGFAVIPVVFTIAEDALSNVPAALSSGSLALGASRWQTVWRVVVPTAVSGIVSAVMIGFGRAVGETMIVVMATGNTAVMEANPFNGMRTLSANIAVELPEAPAGHTHFRALFLGACCLFLLTFLLNTLAEVLRQRLRERYKVV